MSEEKRPRATMGVYIFNKKGQILMAKSPKWSDQYVVPGGHVDYGEKVEDAAIREVKEETGLDVKNPELITVINMIEPEDFTKYTAHFVGLQYRVELIDENQKPELDERELTEYKWITPEEIVADENVEPFTRKVVQDFLVNKKSKKLFNKKCKNCEKNENQSLEYKAGWQRAQADYKNLQKEIEEKRSELLRWSKEQILGDFIPVYDNFKKAFASRKETDDKEIENWAKGIEYIMKQFGDILKAHNIEEIETVGQEFNPEFHEAMSEENSEEFEEGVIIREIDAGYTMKEKVIKVAKVVVCKK